MDQFFKPPPSYPLSLETHRHRIFRPPLFSPPSSPVRMIYLDPEKESNEGEDVVVLFFLPHRLRFYCIDAFSTYWLLTLVVEEDGGSAVPYQAFIQEKDSIWERWIRKQKQGKSNKRSTDDNLRKESFDGSRKDINAAIDRICEFTGTKIILWDLREPFIENVYRPSVSESRLETTLIEPLDVEPNQLCDIIVEPLRDRIVLLESIEMTCDPTYLVNFVELYTVLASFQSHEGRVLGLIAVTFSSNHDVSCFAPDINVPSQFMRNLIDDNSSSELLEGTQIQDLYDLLEIKLVDFQINLFVPFYPTYYFPILENLNASSALALCIVQDESLLKAMEVILTNATTMSFEVRFDIPFGVSPKILDPVYPGHKFPLPLHLAESDNYFALHGIFRVLFNALAVFALREINISKVCLPKREWKLIKEETSCDLPSKESNISKFPISTYNSTAMPTVSVADGSTSAPIDLNVSLILMPQEDSCIDCFSYSKEKELTVEIVQQVGFKICSDDPILNEVMDESGEGLGIN
ncbi:unnamed protein product [Lactuca saligna]|uniref:PATROL1-like C-terminal domain-containing protein n=1 Tax=Lactuca saligna TaxID=75948 RepID=A0AA35Z4F4_LACSI|nr:unnamed protein product [Lactuca saligna]